METAHFQYVKENVLLESALPKSATTTTTLH